MREEGRIRHKSRLHLSSSHGKEASEEWQRNDVGHFCDIEMHDVHRHLLLFTVAAAYQDVILRAAFHQISTWY